MLKRYKRGIAIVLLLTFAQDIFLPSTLWALTGGPSQPEVNSFEPIGTNQMVDLSSGDFNYNIPLMVVPGPNGSYPINLAYHAGVGMEQEATWVGLGWNINPGAITRNMRGVPDDFKGDKIVKKMNMKPNTTVGLSYQLDQLVKGDKEWLGFKLSEISKMSQSIKIYYNNYRGVGATYSITPLTFSNELKNNKSMDFGFTFEFDSNTGIGVDAKVGFSWRIEAGRKMYHIKGRGVGFGFNTSQGLTSIRFDTKKASNFVNGALTSFVMSTYVPDVNTSLIGFNSMLGFTFGEKDSLAISKKNTTIRGEVTSSFLKDKERQYNTYGGIYLSDQSADGGIFGHPYNQMLDFNVANDGPINKNSVNMGLPFMTTDLYAISGQGIGGSFCMHRNDIGRFFNAGNTSNIISGSFAVEALFGRAAYMPASEFHFGFDPIAGNHHSYSGLMTNGTESLDDPSTDGGVFEFRESSYVKALYEPFYFKVVGDVSAVPINEWNTVNNNDPIAFDLGMRIAAGSLKPIVKNNSENIGGKVTVKSEDRPRVKRSQNIEYLTKGELTLHEEYGNRASHFYTDGQYPGEVAGQKINYNELDATEANVDHHIHEYSILKEDGSRYTYGLPAYITKHEENIFSTEVGTSMYSDKVFTTYESSDASVENDKGLDHYFMGTEIPSYVHSHMITEITSADYVDLTGNGPSEDDFGFYTKFNYLAVEDYQWRDPYYDADYIKGTYSNDLDDKASFAYGSKNLYYVHSIETKTHIAIFEMGDRADGRGVSSRDQKETDPKGEKQKYLKRIVLYSKNDPNYGTPEAIPLQTVYFEYDYSLCQGVYNNYDGDLVVDSDHIKGNQEGKLTLKKVYITYNGNEKGRLSPYEFDYGNNPDYSRLNLDRWGNYQEPNVAIDGELGNIIHPYTRQEAEVANTNAAAWNLSTIHLPSGGTIDMVYESDDYGYVQDKRAAEMIEIIGFSEKSAISWTDHEDKNKITKKNLRLWFKADALEGVTGTDRELVAKQYVDGLSEIYFKVYEELKFPYDAEEDPFKARDYVEGYAVLDKTGTAYCGADAAGGNYAYIDLKKAEYKTIALDLFSTHPMRKAGWQYLRYSRPDLFNDQANYDGFIDGLSASIGALANFVGSAMEEAVGLFTLGQYNKYAMLGYCQKMSFEKRSFVRLNSPDKQKFGGGHRIKSIGLADNWTEGERSFGKVYEYTNEDGSTSGVADYEPIVGGEENALKSRISFNGNDQVINFQDQDFFFETPFAEALYPGARVVYGRVVEKNIDESTEIKNFDQAQVGISVSEFYTAKDYPVITKSTRLNQTKGYRINMIIPFVGMHSTNNKGYSQGYTVILNDMSGKPKAMSTYPYRDGNVEGQPISEVRYRYSTSPDGTLNNKLNVLDQHGEIRLGILGEEQDFTMYEDENTDLTFQIGMETNLNAELSDAGLVIIIPTYRPVYNHSEGMFRGISTSKVIRKTGILEEVEAYSDGSTVVTKNLLFDAETGTPLLTSVNNEWDKPVYNYTYPAHWNYDGMAGAYKNYRAAVRITGFAGGNHLADDMPNTGIICLGDEITFNDGGVFKTYYVTEIADDLFFTLQDKNGEEVDLSGDGLVGTITRSGRRNMLNAKSGSIVALSKNFLYAVGGLSPQFVAWNTYVTGADLEPFGIPDEVSYLDLNTNSMNTYAWDSKKVFVPNVYDCMSGEFSTYNLEITELNASNREIIFRNGDNCVGTLSFVDGPGDDTPFEDGYIFPVMIDGVDSYTEQLDKFQIVSEVRDPETGVTESVQIKYTGVEGVVYTANWSGGYCWQPCEVADILHSDAVVYSDDWESSYPYADLGDPEVDVADATISSPSINKYRYGKKGIWRAKKTYLFQINRKQTADDTEYDRTKIDVDGEYEPWEPYSWLPGHLNPKWDWVSEITRYSPYGFGLEEKSRLGYDPDAPLTEDPETAIYSSQMYGHNNSVVISSSALATYFEIGFTGFEEKDQSLDANNTGHINLVTSGTYNVSNLKSHTGTNSLQVANDQTLNLSMVSFDMVSQVLKGIPNKKYIVSLWVNTEETDSQGNLTIGGTTVSTNQAGEVIDGWKKLEMTFTMPETGTLAIAYSSDGNTFIDDLRVGPYDGGMVTYVYDRRNLWLLAELDALNYATFYNYDSEGNLVQVKKETEKGIVTVKTARSNTLKKLVE